MDYVLPCGITITINYGGYEPADYDSGVYCESVGWWTITHVGNRSCSVKVRDWLMRRISVHTEEDILMEVNDYVFN